MYLGCMFPSACFPSNGDRAILIISVVIKIQMTYQLSSCLFGIWRESYDSAFPHLGDEFIVDTTLVWPLESTSLGVTGSGMDGV